MMRSPAETEMPKGRNPLESALSEIGNIESQPGYVNRIKNLRKKLENDLSSAIYLGMGWIQTDGVLKSNESPEDDSQRRRACMNVFVDIQHFSLHGTTRSEIIDRMFSQGRESFSDADYAKLPFLFELYFRIKNEAFDDPRIIRILMDLHDGPDLKLAVPDIFWITLEEKTRMGEKVARVTQQVKSEAEEFLTHQPCSNCVPGYVCTDHRPYEQE